MEDFIELCKRKGDLVNGLDIIVDCDKDGKYHWGVPTEGGYFVGHPFYGLYQQEVRPITRIVTGDERVDFFLRGTIFSYPEITKTDFVDLECEIPGKKYLIAFHAIQVLDGEVIVRCAGNVASPLHFKSDLAFRLHNREVLRFKPERLMIREWEDLNQEGDIIEDASMLLDMGNYYVHICDRGIYKMELEHVHTYELGHDINGRAIPIALSGPYVYTFWRNRRLDIKSIDSEYLKLASNEDFEYIQYETKRDDLKTEKLKYKVFPYD